MRERGYLQTKYWPSGSQYIPPIPDPDASVVLIHYVSKVSISQRWVDLLARLWTHSRQVSSSFCTSIVILPCLPTALLIACCTRVNMPLDPETDKLMLSRISKRLCHLRREVVRALLGMAASAAASFYFSLGERQSRW